jgi:peptidoglycan/LPS O-acetylase OafA/YrhL
VRRFLTHFFRYEVGRSRLIQLDVLRGIAILLVLLNHWPKFPGSDLGWLRDLSLPLSAGFWSGVDLFFVLSGFLIGGILISEKRATGAIDIKRFWIRRGFKIWPSYYIYVAVLAVLTALFYVDHSIPGAQLAGLKVNAVKLFYVQNYFHSTKLPYVPVPLGNHTWSLAVEEHFYILLPLVLLALERIRRVSFPMVTAAMMIGCLSLRLLHYNRPMDWTWDYKVTHVRLDSLFVGVFLAYLSYEHTSVFRWCSRHRMLLGAVGLAFILPMSMIRLGDGPFVRTIGYTFLAVGYSCLLIVFVTTEPGEGPLGRAMDSSAGRAVAWVGFWSYSIYLWHIELVNLIEYLAAKQFASSSISTSLWPKFPWNDLWFLTYLTATIVLGALIGHLIERPILVLRDRIYPSRVRSAVERDWSNPSRPDDRAGNMDSERTPTDKPDQSD